MKTSGLGKNPVFPPVFVFYSFFKIYLFLKFLAVLVLLHMHHTICQTDRAMKVITEEQTGDDP